MTKFNKAQFNKGGEYVEYCLIPMPCPFEQRKFVARFKYNRGGKASFISFLCKHFTVEEYFARREAGEAPLKILESKGYLLPHVKKELIKHGLPLTIEGRDTYMRTIYGPALDRMCARVRAEKAAREAAEGARS